MAENISYLKQLTFDKILKNLFIAKYLTNPRLVIVLILTIILIGVNSFLTLPRTLNPDIKIPIVLISTVLPGAGPKDVESLVTIPLEDSVNGLSNLKTVTSSSRDSVSIITLEFNSGIDPEKARSDTQSAIDTVSTLPTDAKTPKVQKLDFQNQPVWSFALTGHDDAASLARFAKILSDKIKDLSSITTVTTSGLDEQEIQILIKPESLGTYRINPIQLSQAIKAAVASYPAGNVRTDTSSFALSIDPAIATIDDIRNLKINLSGTTVSLADIATISYTAKPDQKESYIAAHNRNPERIIRFDVFKTSASDITKAATDAEKVVAQTLATYNNRFEVATILKTSDEIEKQFKDLQRDFWITVGLVFITLFIFLGVRQALVAILAAPLTFLLSFTVMKLTGISLNFIAMFSLLLSLGLLVDDTIVIVSAMTAYARVGGLSNRRFSGIEAGLLVWRDFIIAVFTTTITTVWAFFPLLLSSGIIGEFIKTIPIVVSSTLMASFGVAMFVTLPVMIILLHPTLPHRVIIFLKILVVLLLLWIFYIIIPKGPVLIFEILAFIIFMVITVQIRQHIVTRTTIYIKKRSRTSPVLQQFPRYIDHGIISFERVSEKYMRVLRKILISRTGKRTVIIMVIIFSLFSYVLLPLGFVKNEFFPKSDSNTIFMSLELPAGTNLATSQKEAIALMQDIRQTPELNFVIGDIGQSIGENGGNASAESNSVLFSLVLLPKEERKTSSIDLANILRKNYATYTKGKIAVIEESGGPPAGADVQIKLFGDDLQILNTYAKNVQIFLATQPKLTNIDTSSKAGTSKLVFVPNLSQMSENGISLDSLGLTLRFYASGFTADTVKFASDSDQKRDVTLRTYTESPSPEALSGLSVASPTTGSVPIASLGTFHLEPNPTLITREGGKRTLSVTASVGKGGSVSESNATLSKFANTQLNLPQGYTWTTGGVNEENQNSVNSILQAMLLSFLLIIITMVLQFGSFRKALIVMLVIPLSISGVFIIFALTHTPLSFPALIGVLALFGIVVKNSILIVDKINQNTKAGMDFTHAIVDGAGSRLEAISLTSFATIIGLIPITLSDPLWQGLGGAIISGLLFSGTIMLFFIPVIYYLWFSPRPVKKS